MCRNCPILVHDTHVYGVLDDNKLLTWGEISQDPDKCSISIPSKCLESYIILNFVTLKYVSINDKVFILKGDQNQYLEFSDSSNISFFQEIEILNNVMPFRIIPIIYVNYGNSEQIKRSMVPAPIECSSNNDITDINVNTTSNDLEIDDVSAISYNSSEYPAANSNVDNRSSPLGSPSGLIYNVPPTTPPPKKNTNPPKINRGDKKNQEKVYDGYPYILFK
jgi:hypothetical protein